MSGLIDMSEAPENPVERLVWLDGIDQVLRREVNRAWQEAYFRARLEGVFDRALDLHLHTPRRAVAWTRHENEARGRVITRWNDGF